MTAETSVTAINFAGVHPQGEQRENKLFDGVGGFFGRYPAAGEPNNAELVRQGHDAQHRQLRTLEVICASSLLIDAGAYERSTSSATPSLTAQ
jgi:hypothetical protein